MAEVAIWVCEEGHVDDHHLEDGGVCLSCGGSGHEAEPGPTGELVSLGPCPDCEADGRATNLLCSRCGGTCTPFSSVEHLAREYVERLRVNVGLVAENKELKRKLSESASPGKGRER